MMVGAGLTGGIIGAVVIYALDGLSFACTADPGGSSDLRLILCILTLGGQLWVFIPPLVPLVVGFLAGRFGGTDLGTEGSAVGAGTIAGLVTGGSNLAVLEQLLGEQGPFSGEFWGDSLDSILVMILWFVAAPVVLGAIGGIVGWVAGPKLEF